MAFNLRGYAKRRLFRCALLCQHVMLHSDEVLQHYPDQEAFTEAIQKIRDGAEALRDLCTAARDNMP